jgi:hypothetical protein
MSSSAAVRMDRSECRKSLKALERVKRSDSIFLLAFPLQHQSLKLTGSISCWTSCWTFHWTLMRARLWLVCHSKLVSAPTAIRRFLCTRQPAVRVELPLASLRSDKPASAGPPGASRREPPPILPALGGRSARMRLYRCPLLFRGGAEIQFRKRQAVFDPEPSLRCNGSL